MKKLFKEIFEWTGIGFLFIIAGFFTFAIPVIFIWIAYHFITKYW